MEDLIKRDDALAAIDTFRRDFEQSWKVQFSADIAALPGINLAGRIEELIKERDELGRRLNTALYGQPHFAWSIHEEAIADLRAKLTKALEERDEYKAAAEICGKAARTMLAELENEQ